MALSNDQLAAKIDSVVSEFKDFVSQQRTWMTGTATGVVTGQPSPGYYPIKDAAGVTRWVPSIEKIKADNVGFPLLELSGANSYVVDSNHNGKVVFINNAGGTTSTTVRFPGGLGKGFNAIYIWTGTQTTLNFSATAPADLNQDQGLTRGRARWSIVSAIAVAEDVIVLSGSMAVGNTVI